MLHDALFEDQSVAYSLAQFDQAFINTLAQLPSQQGELDLQADSKLRDIVYKIVGTGFGAGKPELAWE